MFGIMTEMNKSMNKSMNKGTNENGNTNGNEDTSKNENLNRSENRKDELEREMSEALTQGDMLREDPQEAIRKNLSARYEVRIQAETDPIAEEIKQYRSIAEEVDGRYDSYLERTTKHKNDGDPQ